MKTVLLILNPNAGGGRARDALRAPLAALGEAGIHVELVATGAPGDARRIAHERAGGADCIAAAGGDGTVAEVAAGILATGRLPARLALLPLGTGNDFGSGIGIRDLAAGVEALLHGTWRTIDAIALTYRHGDQAHDQVALIAVGVGAPAIVLRYTTLRAKRWLGRYSYLYAALRTALTYRSPLLNVAADGVARDGAYFLGAVANMEYTAGRTIQMAPGAQPDDGVLELLLVRDLPPLRRLALLPRLGTGQHLAIPGIELDRVREVSIDAAAPVPLNIDGELRGTTPVTLKVLPAAIEVRVPAAS